MEPATTIGALGAIAAWLNLLLQHGKREQQERKEAIEALFQAAVATRSYVSKLKPPRGHGESDPDIAKEAALAQLWMSASFKLEEVDWGLARKCEVKSGYWSEPEQWTANDIVAANIGLDNIIKQASELRAASR